MRRFILLSVVAAVALFAAPPATLRAADANIKVAHIKLKGDLDEMPSPSDPLLGVAGENLRLRLDRIKKAKDDKDIQALYLQLSGISLSWGKLDELRAAVKDFRASGKKAFAFLETGDSKDYLLALACDEVIIPESGTLDVVGMRAEVTYYKRLLENINIKVDVLRMGEYKAAVEPFIRSDMSPEAKKQLEGVIDDFFENSYVKPIVEARADKKWTTDKVKKLIDEGPYTARAAVAAGLVDRLAYQESIPELIKEELKADKVVVSRDYGKTKGEEVDFSNIFAIMKLLQPPKVGGSAKPKIAVIYASGPIMHGKGGQGIFGDQVIGSTTLIEAIKKAEDDKTVKAIVLRVDSPGGDAYASDLIWHELNRSKKPIVSSMSDVAASGGYYITMASNKVFAEPGTLTGSIGVFGIKMVTGDLEKRVGLDTTVIKRGANSGIMSGSDLYTDSERKAMQAVVADVYDQFLSKAIAGRKKAGKEMAREKLEKLAGGRIWTGRQAKENGLIDELGTLGDAIAAAKDLAGMKGQEMELLELPRPKTFIEMLVNDKDEEASLGLSLKELQLLREIPGMERHLRTLESMVRLKGAKVWAMNPYSLEVK